MNHQQELVIKGPGKKVLNKEQQTFNRLIKKLEKLRSSKESLLQALNDKLDSYVKNILPLEESLGTLHAQCAKILYKLYHQPIKLSKPDKELLQKAIARQICEFRMFSREELDGELKEIFHFAEKRSFEDAKRDEFEEMKDEMGEMLRSAGLEVDLSRFSSDLSEDEMRLQMENMFKEFREHMLNEEDGPPERKKTKRELKQEEQERQVEEAKKKSISSIYKQLARALHPDLEQDSQRKEEKESLMKELTGAYENGDLHTLLRLELEWLQKEEDNLQVLSNQKLKIYNQVLKEQIEELEMEIDLCLEHPRYLPLHRYSRFDSIEKINFKTEKKILSDTISGLEYNISRLSSDNPRPALKELIRETKDQDLEEAFFEEIGGMFFS